MPIYEYECTSCCQVHEVLQKMSEKPIKKCPVCGGKVKKLMSMNTFHLKGSGWYVTDYAGKKNNAPPKKSEKAEKKAETKTEKKASGGSTDASD